MNQREQFEGQLTPFQVELFRQREQLYWQSYSDWLEQRNKELVAFLFDVKEAIYNAPDDAFGIVARPDSNGDPEPQPVKHELLFAIQQQLKKNGAL